MIDDENHEAHGAMVHRGLVEQRVAEDKARCDEISALKDRVKELEYELAVTREGWSSAITDMADAGNELLKDLEERAQILESRLADKDDELRGAVCALEVMRKSLCGSPSTEPKYTRVSHADGNGKSVTIRISTLLWVYALLINFYIVVWFIMDLRCSSSEGTKLLLTVLVIILVEGLGYLKGRFGLKNRNQGKGY